MNLNFRFYFPKKYMGEFCVVASPPLQVMEVIRRQSRVSGTCGQV